MQAEVAEFFIEAKDQNVRREVASAAAIVCYSEEHDMLIGIRFFR